MSGDVKIVYASLHLCEIYAKKRKQFSTKNDEDAFRRMMQCILYQLPICINSECS